MAELDKVTYTASSVYIVQMGTDYILNHIQGQTKPLPKRVNLYASGG